MVSIRQNASNWRTYAACAGLGLAITIGVANASNPPAPGDGESQGHHQRPTAQEHQGATNSAYPAQTPPSANTVEIHQPPSVNKISAQSQKQTQWYDAPDWWLVLVTAGLWGFTALMWNETRKLGKDSIKASEAAVKSAAAMEKNLLHAESSANAAAQTASILRDTASRNLRAYLTVINGNAIFQEKNRERGGDLRFEAKPLIVNTGQTPAKKVSYRAAAAILPTPIPIDFDFPLDTRPGGPSTLGAHGNFVMSATVSDFVEDCAVEQIKFGNRSSLYIWGTITYEDVFENPQITNFCLRYQWLLNGEVTAFYETDHNDAS